MESININWYLMGAKLAALGSNEQNAFFRGFCDELFTYESKMAYELQLISIREGKCKDEKPFTNKQKEVFQLLGDVENE